VGAILKSKNKLLGTLRPGSPYFQENTMTSKFSHKRLWTALFVTLALAQGAAWAEKPDWAGHGGGKGNQGHKYEDDKGGKQASKSHDQSRRTGKQVPEIQFGSYFGGSQRDAARDYYGSQYSGKRCPPGLAKKNNGCMPPGQAKKWSVGHTLPRDVVFYPVPQTVSVRIGVPPSGYRYVRVANDILLIAIGTSMVVDAIENLMQY
jgi:Ni/Co efflux regulator RcnB